MAVETINLGFVKSIFVGISPPSNIKCIWYDSSVGQEIHKVYNTVTGVWEPLNSGSSIDVIDNLTSTSTTNALSANQGRVLNERITSVSTALSQDIDNLTNTVNSLDLNAVTTVGNTTANSIVVGNVEANNIISNGLLTLVSSGVTKGNLTSDVSNLILEGQGNNLLLRRQASTTSISLGTNITFSGILEDDSQGNAITITSTGVLRKTPILTSNRTIFVTQGLTGGGSLTSNINIGIDQAWFDSRYEQLVNKAINLSSPNNTTYPTTKAVSDAINATNLTFENGLTKNGNVVKLGGPLTNQNDTTIGTANTSGKSSIALYDHIINIITFHETTNQYSYLTANQNGAFIGARMQGLVSRSIYVPNDNAQTITITDAASKGAVYAADYSANFTDHSLVTKLWVENQIATVSVLNTQLVGYQPGLPAQITQNDTVLSAFENLQAQVNATIPSSRTLQIIGSSGVISSNNNPQDLSLNRTWTLTIDPDYTGFNNYYTITQIDGIVSDLAKPPQPIDCSTNPNYPAASAGDSYKVSVAGRIGGASGPLVEVGDLMIASVDTPSGDQATVGANWGIYQTNIDKATETIFGTGRIATTAELTAGTNNQAWVTPQKLAAYTGFDNRYYTKTQLQTSTQASVHWLNITNTPTSFLDYGLDDVCTTWLSRDNPVRTIFAGDVNSIIATGVGHVRTTGSTNLPMAQNGGFYSSWAIGADGGKTQMFISTNDSDQFWFRRMSSTNFWGAWIQVASRSWVTDQLTPINERGLQEITDVGNTTTNSIRIFGNGNGSIDDGLIFSHISTTSSLISSYTTSTSPLGSILFNDDGITLSTTDSLDSTTLGVQLNLFKSSTSGTDIAAWFHGRVRGASAVNADEFVTKSQLTTTIGGDFVAGRAVFSGDGIKTEFDIPHGSTEEILYVSTHPGSSDAAGIWMTQLTIDNPNVPAGYIRVRYTIAPASGVDNIIIYWAVKKAPVVTLQSDLSIIQEE